MRKAAFGGRTKCGLNLSREREGPINVAKPEDLYIYSSDRVAQLTGNGVLTLTHEQFRLDQLFTDDEMVFFGSNDDLIDKIAHFLDNEDERRRRRTPTHCKIRLEKGARRTERTLGSAIHCRCDVPGTAIPSIHLAYGKGCFTYLKMLSFINHAECREGETGKNLRLFILQSFLKKCAGSSS